MHSSQIHSHASRVSAAPVVNGFDAFQALISASFVPMQVSSFSPETFRSRVRSAEADHVQLTDIVASRHSVVRTGEHIRQFDEPYLKVNVQLAGTGLLIQDERQAVLRPGDLAVYDTQRAFSLAFEDDSRSLVVMFPKSALDIPAEILEHMTAVTISGRTGIGSVVAPFLVQLANKLEQLTSPIGPRLAHNLLDLVATTFSAELGAPGPERNPNEVLLQRVLDYIDVNLGSSDLTPDKIAAAHFVSTRHLYGLFQAQGTTIASWVRTRRLERCCRDLHDPSIAARSISAIASRWGFLDSAHFCRVFKAYSGLTPSEYRALCRIPSSGE